MNRLFLSFCVWVLTGAVAALHAQHPNVFISSQSNPNETAIAVNPRNPDQLVAAANINRGYYSSDGGYTWTSFVFTCPWGVWGDPVLLTDTAGSFYFFHLSNPTQGNGGWIDRIVCQRMDGFSHQWNNGSYVGLNGSRKQDKPWAAIDARNNNLYVCWTQFDNYGSAVSSDSSIILFSRSTDRGETWSTPQRINSVAGDCVDSDNTVEGAVPAVGPNGEIYVTWAGPNGLVFDRSLDEGNTWLSNDIAVLAPPGGWDYAVPGLYRANGLPVTACDTSHSAHRGNIYINWTDQGNGNDNTDVWIVRSQDGGNTWQQPVRVNDDLGLNRHQFLSWMCVDQANGNIYVVFYDRRNYDQQNTDVYLAASFDGGLSFVNVKISESPFVPNEGNFLGDYINITAYNNLVRPIWTRGDNAQTGVWTAIVNQQLLYVEKQERLPMAVLEDGFPNPFRDETRLAFTLPVPSEVSIEVFDCYGRIVPAAGSKALYPAGKHEHVFHENQFGAPGMYTVCLVTGGFRQMRRMVLAK